MKNMPFKGQEDALLEARKASSPTLFITDWFIEDYKLDYRRYYSPIQTVFSTTSCDTFYAFIYSPEVSENEVSSSPSHPQLRQLDIPTLTEQDRFLYGRMDFQPP